MNYSALTLMADVIIMAVQQFLQGWFLARFIRTGKPALFCTINTVLYTVGYTAVQLLFPDLKGIVNIAMMLITFGMVLMFRQRSAVRSILYTLFFFVVLMVLDYLSVLMYNSLLPRYASDMLNASFSSDTSFPSLNLGFLCLLRMTGVIEVVLSGLIPYFILRGNSNADDDFDKRVNRFIPLFVLELVSVGFLLIYTSNIAVETPNVMWLVVAFLVVFLAIDFLVWNILRIVENSEKLRHEKIELALIAEANSAAYRQITESSIRFRSLRHDLLNQLQTTGILLKNGETEAASKQLLSYTDSVRNSGSSITGNNIVDAILSIKQRTCLDSGIILDVEGRLPGKTPLEDSELCSVIGNMLDNAINAASKTVTSGKGEIHITFSAGMRDEKLVISCKNPVSAPVSNISSAPAPENEHGWGRYILNRIAGEYSGAFTLYSENGTASALFWVPADAEDKR